MAEAPRSRPWAGALVLLVILLTLAFFRLLPLETMPRQWAGPDLMLAFTLVWVIRRPDYVPVTIVALVFLLADLIFQRPPGLLAALVVIGSEMLRARARALRMQNFWAEWTAFVVAVVSIVLLNRSILTLTGVPNAPGDLVALQLAQTVAVYPVVVAVSALAFGVRKVAPGELDVAGTRL